MSVLSLLPWALAMRAIRLVEQLSQLSDAHPCMSMVLRELLLQFSSVRLRLLLRLRFASVLCEQFSCRSSAQGCTLSAVS